MRVAYLSLEDLLFDDLSADERLECREDLSRDLSRDRRFLSLDLLRLFDLDLDLLRRRDGLLFIVEYLLEYI